MEGRCRIVGISLVRNEDLFLDRVLKNARAFCDVMIIADHGSRDGTAAIGRRWAASDDAVEYRRLRNASKSHDLVRLYAGTRTWIFAVDGDEIYDPAGLARLREAILRGDYDRYRQIYGHALHCDELDLKKKTACGYLSPPCRTVTKLYNFGAIEDWEGPCPERLHGGRIVFRKGYDASSNKNLHREVDWEESSFRCLHAVFLRRSSLDGSRGAGRLNISEKNSRGLVSRMTGGLRNALGDGASSAYKSEKYRREPRVCRDAGPFLEDAP
jgi:glycosyltransferase involved in cell wall biosynthesis